MGFEPLGETRVVGDTQIQYLRDATHGHEGGHRIALTDKTVTVLPDGRTTATNRSHVITRVLHSLPASHPLAVEALVGALVMAGATHVEVDGEKILTDEGSVVATLRLEVVQYGPDEGAIRVTSIGGAG